MRTIYKFEYQKKHNKQLNILLTKPKDLDFEILVFTKYWELMKTTLAKRESSSTLEQDLALLDDKSIPYTRMFGILYRAEKKKILKSQIDLA